jgi:hypothetical protein
MEDRLSQQEVEHEANAVRNEHRETDQGPEAARPMLLQDPEKENHEG